MLDFNATYNDIKTKLETDLSPVPIYDSGVPVNAPHDSTNGFFNPYIVLSIGGGIRERQGRHVADIRMDPLSYWVTVVCVAPQDAEARKLKGRVLKTLIGYVPVDASQLEPTGGQAQSTVNENRIPALYQHRAMFKFIGNMTTEIA